MNGIGIPMSRERQSGQIELLVLIAIVILFAYFVSGGLFPRSEPSTVPGSTAGPGGQCCDTADCSLVTGTEIAYEGRQYRLLKSDISLTERWGHLNPSTATIEDGRRIFLNMTSEDGSPGFHPYCGPPENDLFFRSGNCGSIQDCCFSLPNNTIIYVCRESCEGAIGFGRFDAYYIDDGTPIHDEIRNCDPEHSIFGNIGAGEPGGDLFVCPSPGTPAQDLQLNACTVVHRPQSSVTWLSPYCKPAIYLYPQQRTDVNVSIAPKGKLTLAIPKYPEEGWNVTAYPDGQIDSQNTIYDYLYYEAEIPDTLIEKPKEGFIVKYDGLAMLFVDLLPKLGLNEKETTQFSEYWLKALPKLPYFFVGVVSTKNLDVIAPLTINPSPVTTIRVTIYFEALSNTQNVIAPTIDPVKRNGFTVVEWGGIVKTDENHPFSCLM